MGYVTCVLLAVFLILVLFKLYLKLTTGWCTSNVCLVGKTAIVTGANTGSTNFRFIYSRNTAK